MKPKDSYYLDIHLATYEVQEALEYELECGEDIPVRPEDLTDEQMEEIAEAMRSILVKFYYEDLAEAMEVLKKQNNTAK